MSDEEITRFEVIDEHGRVYVRWNCHIELSRQDGGRTLKVFVRQQQGVDEIRYAPELLGEGRSLLIEEVTRLRAALEWYADKVNGSYAQEALGRTLGEGWTVLVAYGSDDATVLAGLADTQGDQKC